MTNQYSEEYLDAVRKEAKKYKSVTSRQIRHIVEKRKKDIFFKMKDVADELVDFSSDKIGICALNSNCNGCIFIDSNVIKEFGFYTCSESPQFNAVYSAQTNKELLESLHAYGDLLYQMIEIVERNN